MLYYMKVKMLIFATIFIFSQDILHNAEKFLQNSA